MVTVHTIIYRKFDRERHKMHTLSRRGKGNSVAGIYSIVIVKKFSLLCFPITLVKLGWVTLFLLFPHLLVAYIYIYIYIYIYMVL